MSPALLGKIFTVVGVILLGCSGWSMKRRHEVLNSWPSVDAEVIESKVERFTTYSMHSSVEVPMYRAQITFRYTVNGKSHVSFSASKSGTSNFANARHQADLFGPGTHHEIRYNPSNPNDICYDAADKLGFFSLPLLFAGMGILFGGIGLILLKAFGAAGVPTPTR
jgi:Protein of unknown function (DUF3592)